MQQETALSLVKMKYQTRSGEIEAVLKKTAIWSLPLAAVRWKNLLSRR
ncbi:hypothetical protein JXA32_06090 [Candidatus Sumerlaeota bacterium]|nr:hypothetical protein [Candidatus Sumerlaeota bacterium]